MPEAVAGYIEGKGLNAGLIYKIHRVSMKNYIDQGWMENVPLYAIEGYLRAEGIPVPEQGE